jgi:hypothetical protein
VSFPSSALFATAVFNGFASLSTRLDPPTVAKNSRFARGGPKFADHVKTTWPLISLNGGKPVVDFDPLQLNRRERDAWAGFCERAGDECAHAMFGLMAKWVGKLLNDGKTSAEVRDKVVGTFYDNVPLMLRGQVIRNETIIVATAMVEQAIDGLRRIEASPADVLRVKEGDGG